MITKKRLVLVLGNEQIADMIRFEAIEFITKESQIEAVWSNNKTPIILESNLSDRIRRRYEILYVPTPYIDSENFIAFCHNNQFECGEFMSQEKFDTSKEDCFLCDIGLYAGHKSATSFNKSVAQDHSLIIYESANFIVKIELGCIVPGMLMICPKAHILSAAQIPSSQEAEYEQVMKDTEWLLKGAFGDKPVIFFEHGSAPNGFSSHQRSIVHAHTHVVWGIKFPQKYLNMVKLKASDIHELATEKYLSYQEGAEGEFLSVSSKDVYVQRQYPRQVIGELMGIPNYKTNWRVEPFEENMRQTFDAIYEFLKKNENFLAQRISKATKCFVTVYPSRKGKSN